METDELSFLRTKYEKESKEFMYAMNVVLKGAVIIPCFAGAWYYIRYHQTQIMWKAYAIAQFITLIFSTIIAYFSYQREIASLKKDLATKTKCIESCIILEKKYMQLNHTFHFYLQSATKYSIEVSENDYHVFNEGDEINIEYSLYNKEYFGYF